MPLFARHKGAQCRDVHAIAAAAHARQRAARAMLRDDDSVLAHTRHATGCLAMFAVHTRCAMFTRGASGGYVASMPSYGAAR